MIRLNKSAALPAVGLTGFETPLGEEESAIQHTVHRFARDVLRPIGRELDRMTPEEVIAPGSPYWAAIVESAKLGLDPQLIAQFPPDTAVRIESLIGEELGWGDAGLAVSIGAATMPLMMAQTVGNRELIEMCAGKVGCWMNTQPDRGSDAAILYRQELDARGRQPVGNVTAKVGADEIVINGQSSAWISNGSVAQVALAYMAADYGDGFYGEGERSQFTNGIAMILPLDLPGVSRGKPLDKIGQRSLPQGEIYFDNVKVPKRFAIALKDDYLGNLASTWSYAGTHMCQVFVGVARAAFELALAYCHERRQGGALLMDHQMTHLRIGEMLRRLEMARAIARRSLAFSRMSPQSHPYATAQAKVSVTEEAMKITHEAFQLFGGNGTTREFPIEKLFRDVRSALIEDGENYILASRLGVLAGQLFQNGWTRE
ncbi:acyl-CoA dehydrogenase family protein [Burkholderia pseudomultivorans]|uniref:acyl-CoA dehydrogenase family protein n=1 Tax=Burkholderia pseudomultivorans TaxID=1207504 RepID=UPI00075CB552|nr:acyl-CoA dehydrogenase family protein [Burkholderia pseudomultivorans]KVC24747.1 acyl-CoA dehydrogenase [Burkholderia pseudomultivorans]KVC31236.1 acyl-CoA dehydrogenase [Burkholderia pseudomultivorans]KWI47529.1 acyl-CoA dehydrogenase [Burkholderia pseudomultivorans]MBF5009004.1 acyl-CoA dehydrogenase [Burkholderia pseudomultivorans]MDS0790840.1 acyl-CoA dehydrogenase family protein [Burkholderia pseudomultivorans]